MIRGAPAPPLKSTGKHHVGRKMRLQSLCFKTRSSATPLEPLKSHSKCLMLDGDVLTALRRTHVHTANGWDLQFFSLEGGATSTTRQLTHLTQEPEAAPSDAPLLEGGGAGAAAAALFRQATAVVKQAPSSSRRMLAGGVAGAISKTATAPLEVLKMQLVQAGQLSTLQAARHVWHTHGLLGFFRGNSLDVLRTMPSKAVELAAFDAYKALLQHWSRRSALAGELQAGQSCSSGRGDRGLLGGVLPDSVIGAVAGALAGATAQAVIHPLETIRTRMAVGAVGGNFWGVCSYLVRTGGVGSLYRVSSVPGHDAHMLCFLRLSTASPHAYARMPC